MGLPAAKKGDQIVSKGDIHFVEIPTAYGVVTMPLFHPFKGPLSKSLSKNVNIMGKPAATKGSWGENTPKHVPLGMKFVIEPSNIGTVFTGSLTVKINGKQAARSGDMVLTCNDPVDLPVGNIIASGNVNIG